MSPIICYFADVVELAMHNAIGVEELQITSRKYQALALVLTSGQEPSRGLSPAEFEGVGLRLGGEASHLLLLLVDAGEQLVHIVHVLEPVHDVEPHHEVNFEPVHASLLDLEHLLLLAKVQGDVAPGPVGADDLHLHDLHLGS